MADVAHSGKDLQSKAENVLHQSGDWVERLARIGYATKGVLYIIIGFLALELAFTGHGKATNTQGALVTINQQPFGQFLLGLTGVGLAGYALWRFIQAVLDVEHKGTDGKGIATRLGLAISGGTYALLAFTAFQLLLGHAVNTDGNRSTQDWTARLLSLPFGQWLVGLAGLVVIGIGIAQFVRGVKTDFRKHLNMQEMSAAYHAGAIWSGRLGYGALGIVLTIVGGFLIEAALHANPKEAKGLGSALAGLQQQPYGMWMLGIVAAGLIAYGLFMLVEARYRAINL